MSQAVVGPGLAAYLNDNDDEAITHERTEHHELGGHTSTIVKVWGRKGLYIASPDSGEWISTGPFAADE